MTVSRLILAILLGVATVFARRRPLQRSSTFDAVSKARSCSRNEVDKQQTDCDYRVAPSLRFSIAGIGKDDAAIVFAKSDIDGDFYASFGLQHKCVIVWPGARRATAKTLGDLAFVSPANGKVYRDWQSCAAHK